MLNLVNREREKGGEEVSHIKLNHVWNAIQDGKRDLGRIPFNSLVCDAKLDNYMKLYTIKMGIPKGIMLGSTEMFIDMWNVTNDKPAYEEAFEKLTGHSFATFINDCYDTVSKLKRNTGAITTADRSPVRLRLIDVLSVIDADTIVCVGFVEADGKITMIGDVSGFSACYLIQLLNGENSKSDYGRLYSRDRLYQYEVTGINPKRLYKSYEAPIGLLITCRYCEDLLRDEAKIYEENNVAEDKDAGEN